MTFSSEELKRFEINSRCVIAARRLNLSRPSLKFSLTLEIKSSVSKHSQITVQQLKY